MPARRPVALGLVGAVSALVLLASPGVAQAAAAPAPGVPSLIGVDTAFAVMPLATVLPGAVRLTLKVETPGSASVEPCPETLVPVSLKGSLVGAQYETANKKTPDEKTASWAITVVVFHTAKVAKAEEARLVKIEKACPKSTPSDGEGDASIPFVRTKSAVYSLGAWAGYRTVDQISQTDLIYGPDPVGERVNTVFLRQGNVLLTVQETGGIEPGTLARQDAWRKSVTTLMLHQLDPLI